MIFNRVPCHSQQLLVAYIANNMAPDQTAPLGNNLQLKTLFLTILIHVHRLIILCVVIKLKTTTRLSISYTMGCPPVRGDNPRALASGLSYVQVDKHGITILYHLHQCTDLAHHEIFHA